MYQNSTINKKETKDVNIIVSIIMPIYNEETFIDECVVSLFKQDYPQNAMEWVFIDGGSTDQTMNILRHYQEQNPTLIKVFDNPNKTVPYAMNIGIKKAKGKYIIRLDAHAKYGHDYISKCIYYLDNTDAMNVGGTLETLGKGKIGEAISKMLSSKFGVGSSQFRVSNQSGYVDTVPFGAFRREIFDKIGYYDERLTRNQDNELNYRIRKHGYNIYLANDINLSYYCRDTLSGIAKMAYLNGKWNVITLKLCPGSMGIRHFVPFVFVLSLLFLIPFSFVFDFILFTLLIECLTYGLLNIIFSYKQANSIRTFLLLLLLFPIFHICYGVGSLVGILKLYKY